MLSNFCHTIYENLRQHPGQACLVWPQPAGPARPYTGADILARTEAFRRQLTNAQVLPGQAVLIAVPVSVELVAALLGTMAHGAVPVLPPAGAGPLALLGLLRRHSIRQAAVGRALAGRYGWLLRLTGVQPLVPDLSTNPAVDVQPPMAVPPDQPALVSHSSGSTGQSKAIRRSHRVLTAQHEVLKQVFPPWPGQRDFPLFPNVLLHNLAVGAVSILPDVPWGRLADFDAARVARQLHSEGVETLTGNVFYFTHLSAFLRSQNHPLLRVRAVGVGGSPVPEKLLTELQKCFPHATIHGIYGSSEAEPIAVRTAGTSPAPPRNGYYAGPVVAGLECRLRKIGQLQLPNGQAYDVGEILVSGPHVAADNWLATGDFGYFDERQHLWLTGRQGNETLVQGVQHYQVEHVLQHLPGVERVAARAQGSGFAVFVQGRVVEETIRAALEAQFPPGLCRQVHFRAQLPVDARHLSKIRYAALR
ncbi:AMP-binding protein [Hymenobacter guriensis]|uniref:AMP-binding protein n=1 Tax=Hymenobacter guriensis TaxID=2793065 RepID=A0ABS0L658_9BACT|nr:AMP-binding protein [Hymenobacter guriensis]MBG8555639.1 AMP-binding protein [Hymenobacter guriensis]